jgi:hypothetical protein
MACPTERLPGICGAITEFLFHLPPFRIGWRGAEKKAEEYITREYLTEALAGFTGYIAADELYDGPFCVLCIVDNRTFKRLLYEVLDHAAKEENILRFFRRFREALDAHGLTLRGITTGASSLYPAPVAEVFGCVSHQICEFHAIAEITKAVLKAVAQVRKMLKARMPNLSRGRPGTHAQRNQARCKKRLQKQVADLFDHRHLLVKRCLTPTEKRILTRISRGQRQLHTLRQIIDEVYRLFDRRCRTETALSKLAKLRQRVRRFKKVGKTLQKLFSPNLEKTLTFLDDSLLPPTSNAVERANRRHRKMQKSVYRVRTQQHVRNRIALDMQRDAQASSRNQTIQTLHAARTGFI